ncbi:MAG: hypothetical protein IKP00_13390 [Victivallales bacterium]|nr:hypothetical protein [Victivallales bacterium]
MSFTFICPHCNVMLEAEDELGGNEAECPSCSKKLIIPFNTNQTPKAPQNSNQKMVVLISVVLLIVVGIVMFGISNDMSNDREKIKRAREEEEYRQRVARAKSDVEDAVQELRQMLQQNNQQYRVQPRPQQTQIICPDCRGRGRIDIEIPADGDRYSYLRALKGGICHRCSGRGMITPGVNGNSYY